MIMSIVSDTFESLSHNMVKNRVMSHYSIIISQMNVEVIEVDGTFVEVRSLWYYQ